MTSYYNEIEPYAAAWLRNLIAAGHIAKGEVDERSIVEVQPDDLRGFTQAHFFAGIGVWSHALRLAGWPDDRPVWTGSCPCQPFSAAGKQEGGADARHLWPVWFRLIEERRPAIVFGEQVAGAAGLAWLDLVWADMEASGYAVAAADLCAAGVGAPHIRQRLYWLADAERGASERHGHPVDAASGGVQGAAREQRVWVDARHGGTTLDMADPAEPGRGSLALGNAGAHGGAPAEPGRLCDARPLADAAIAGPQGRERTGERPDAQRAPAERGGAAGELVHTDRARSQLGWHAPATLGHGGAADTAGSPGFWSAVEWIACRDGKARPTGPGLFPLAHGAPARVGRLRAYGNAIVAPVAAEFIGAAMECMP